MTIENVTTKSLKQCALCGLTESEVNVLVTGVNSFVCSECVRRSNDILSVSDLSDLPDDGLVEVLLNPGVEFQIQCSELAELLEMTSPAMAVKNERRILNGLLIEIEKGKLRAVATNTHWLAACEIKVSHDVDKMQHLILASESVFGLLNKLNTTDEVLTVSIKDNCFCVDADVEIYREQLLLGNYPNYRKLLPDHPHSVILDRNELLSVVKKLKVNEKFKGLNLTLSKEALLLKGESGDWQKIDIDYRGEEIKTGFNQDYLIDILQLIKGDNLKIGFQRAVTVWQFEAVGNTNAIYLLMPMRIE